MSIFFSSDFTIRLQIRNARSHLLVDLVVSNEIGLLAHMDRLEIGFRIDYRLLDHI